MILEYKVTLLVLNQLSESYIFSCSFCDKLQLKESKFFLFLKTGPDTPDIIINMTKLNIVIC